MPRWYQLTELSLSTIPPEAPIIDTSKLCIEMFLQMIKVSFYTSFPTYNHFMISYNFLGDAANCTYFKNGHCSLYLIITIASMFQMNVIVHNITEKGLVGTTFVFDHPGQLLFRQLHSLCSTLHHLVMLLKIHVWKHVHQSGLL